MQKDLTIGITATINSIGSIVGNNYTLDLNTSITELVYDKYMAVGLDYDLFFTLMEQP